MTTIQKKVVLLLLSIALFPILAFGQSTAPIRPLPPSMRIELAKEASSKHKTIIFRDTLKSAQLQSALSRDTSSIADSLLGVVKDSALATVDSSVAEPTKAHLDSAIAELPEFSRVENKAHFEYPLSIMTESYRNAVPFDSTVLKAMNPISRENLPYFDQHPMPLPLKPNGLAEGHLSLGAGTPHLPYIEGGWARTFNETWALNLEGTFFNNIQSDPLQLYWNAAANLSAELGEDPSPNRSSSFDVSLSTEGKKLALARDTAGTAFEMNHMLSLEALTASLAGQWADHSTYSISTGLHLLSDNVSSSSDETSEWLQGQTAIRFGHSDFGMQGFVGIEHAGSEQVLLPASFSVTTSSDLLAQNYKLRITDAGASAGIVWTAGLNVFAGSDINGARSPRILPAGSIKFQLTPDWTIGGSFDPQSRMMDHARLVELSPFFTPVTGMEALVKDSGNARSTDWQKSASDPRRVSMDKFDLIGFTNYTLSADDEVHAQIEIADRDNTVAFFQHSLDSGRYSFYALPEEIKQISLRAGSNLLFFTSDILTLNVEYNSFISQSTGTSLPFEPTLKVHAAYRLNGLSDWIKPSVEFDHIGLPDRSFSFLNLRVDIILSSKFAILLHCENLFGSASDYWTGYNELPRSIWGALSFKF